MSLSSNVAALATRLATEFNTLRGEVAERARDALGSSLVAGSGITITPNDGADTITIAATGSGGASTTTIGALTATTTVGASDSFPLVQGGTTKRIAGSDLRSGIGSAINVVLSADFSTTNATDTNVTGLAFTPAANKTYEVRALLLLRTTTATVGPRPGISWPTVTDGASSTYVPTTNTAQVQQHRGARTTANAASTGVPTTTDSYLGEIIAIVVAGASPSGNFQVTLASETAGTSVTCRAGSFLSYREIS